MAQVRIWPGFVLVTIANVIWWVLCFAMRRTPACVFHDEHDRCTRFYSQDISITVLLLLQELTDSDVLSEREEAAVIVDAIVDKQVLDLRRHSDDENCPP